MSTFEYKVNKNDTLQFGDSSNTISIPGKITADKSVSTFEEVTTTGTADVLDPSISRSIVTSGGAHSVTLADGTFVGQVKKVYLVVDGGTMTLTPAHLSDGTNIVFADVYGSVELIFDGTDWNISQASGITVS